MVKCKECIYYGECAENTERQINDDSLECIHFRKEKELYTLMEYDDEFYIN